MKLMILLCCLYANHVFSKTLEFSGVAKNSKNEVAYLEEHKAEFKDDKVLNSTTQYFDINHKLIAELNSNYKKSLYLPDYTFEDFRTGMKHTVSLSDKKLIVNARKTKDSADESREFEVSENMISGQGFHYFIRENLNVLADAKNKDVKFVMPGLLDYFNFNIVKDRALASEDTGNIVFLKMTVNSIFLKLFVTTIKMQYDKAKKHLLYYKGVSNLVTPEGENQSVEITYKYPNS